MIKEEKALEVSCLANVATIHEGIGDKSLQDQIAINYLNSKSKTYLHFACIHDR